MITDIQFKLMKINRLVELLQNAERVEIVDDDAEKVFSDVTLFLLDELTDNVADLVQKYKIRIVHDSIHIDAKKI